jgi:uncharacterized Fe-S radical SAM superfamily protein PflX
MQQSIVKRKQTIICLVRCVITGSTGIYIYKTIGFFFKFYINIYLRDGPFNFQEVGGYVSFLKKYFDVAEKNILILVEEKKIV